MSNSAEAHQNVWVSPKKEIDRVAKTVEAIVAVMDGLKFDCDEEFEKANQLRNQVGKFRRQSNDLTFKAERHLHAAEDADKKAVEAEKLAIGRESTAVRRLAEATADRKRLEKELTAALQAEAKFILAAVHRVRNFPRDADHTAPPGGAPSGGGPGGPPKPSTPRRRKSASKRTKTPRGRKTPKKDADKKNVEK